MTDINQDVVLFTFAGESVLIHPCSRGSCHLNSYLLTRNSTVVADRSLIRHCSSNSDVRQRIADTPNQWQLSDCSILGRTPSSLLMHHTEAGEIAICEIARVGIRPGDQEVRSKFHHTKRSRDAREVIATIMSPSAISFSDGLKK